MPTTSMPQSPKECMRDCINPKAVKIISSAEGKDLTRRTTGPLDKMTGN
jgi:cytochrome c